ncbi:hypothetical protein KAZ82_00515, partial [Candidatus Babeliales bacterium]|nr:hypothetical protein [Candidatus Babeliales bacterium]
VLNVNNIVVPLKASRFNRHLLWAREIWGKIMLSGNIKEHNHYLQAGLIPYEIGRAISLGAAYQTIGFLGFTPTYSISEYAPGVVLSFNPKPSSIINFYIAVTDTNQDNITNIFEEIHTQEIDTNCKIRGVDATSYIAAIDARITLRDVKNHTVMIEPYVLFYEGVNKKLELANDIDADLSTAGVCVEADFGRVNWGFECAKNFGKAFVKALDRNSYGFTTNVYADAVVEFTKVYNMDPANPNAQLAYATYPNIGYVDASTKSASENGKQIGPDLWNAYDRFRPAQNFGLSGYYFIADAEFDYIPKSLKGAFGVGYFSGSPRKRVDLNAASFEACMNQSYAGFIPLQSIYSGKRIRHFVMLNQGVPRYTIQSPQQSVVINATTPLSLDTMNATTNLVFAGTRVAYTPNKFKKNKVLFAPNLIAYWAADTSYVSDENLPVNSPFLKELDNYLGTEINMEFSFEFYNDLKFLGYAGILFPGTYYKQIAGTYVKDFNVQIGCSPAFISNFALSYSF